MTLAPQQAPCRVCNSPIREAEPALRTGTYEWEHEECYAFVHGIVDPRVLSDARRKVRLLCKDCGHPLADHDQLGDQPCDHYISSQRRWCRCEAFITPEVSNG